ncbi:MAG: class I SAM-dependent methyltransferase [Candidatus Zixiibacteriota bacterium]
MPVIEIDKKRDYHDIVTFAEQADNAELEHNRARQVISVCNNFSFQPLNKLTCIDLGLSTDIYRECYRENFGQVIYLDDINKPAGNRVSAVRSGNTVALSSDMTELSLPDNSADVVICNQIYGRVNEPQQLMSEIYRVLKYGGFCYFSAENKFRLVKREKSGKNKLKSLGNLKKLTNNFWRHDFTSLIICHPESFSAESEINLGRYLSKLPGRIFFGIYPFLSGWVWVLTKKK